MGLVVGPVVGPAVMGATVGAGVGTGVVDAAVGTGSGVDVVGATVVGAVVVGATVGLVDGVDVVGAAVGFGVGAGNVVFSFPSDSIRMMSASSASWPVHQFHSDDITALMLTRGYSVGKLMDRSFHSDSPTFLDRAV